jgi:ribosome biogenesis GTPase / thiamine phosphate phosphatase
LSASLHGIVVSAYGKRYDVELENGRVIGCVTRGKKTDLACGDQVDIALTANDQGVVERYHPRQSLLYRSNAYKTKILAANVTQAVIVLATQPSFYEGLLNRCLVAAEAANVAALIVLNKSDLDMHPTTSDALALYASLGYQVVKLSATHDISPLRPLLAGHTSILIGQSGMGKSTIVNALLPDLRLRTQEVSSVLDSGKHTTTATHLYHLDQNSHLIDSPGMQEFGVHHLQDGILEKSFVEFRPFLGKCRFNNCRHLSEPDCAITTAVASGAIHPRRLEYYQTLLQEISH